VQDIEYPELKQTKENSFQMKSSRNANAKRPCYGDLVQIKLVNGASSLYASSDGFISQTIKLRETDQSAL